MLLITLEFFFALPQTVFCDCNLCWGGWKHNSLWIVIIILLEVQIWIAREFKSAHYSLWKAFLFFKCMEPVLQLQHLKLQLHWNFITELILLYLNFYCHCNLSMLLCLIETRVLEIILVFLYKQNKTIALFSVVLVSAHC